MTTTVDANGRKRGRIAVGDPAALPAADVVVITPYFGWPPVSGGWQRLLHSARGLSRAHRVVLVTQHDGTPRPGELEGFLAESGCVGAVVVGEDDREGKGDPAFEVWAPLRVLVHDLLRTTLPRYARRWRSRTLAEVLATVRRSTGADIAWVFDPAVVEDARGAGFGTILLDMDDVMSEVERAELRQLGRVKRLPVLYADYLRLRRWERALPRRLARVVVAKEDDRRFFPARHHGRLALLPNGVRLPAEPAGSDGDARTLLFVGTLDYAPNDDALRYFLDDVLPSIRARRPDARFQIVGRGVVPWLRERVAADPQLALAESAPDVRPFYDEAAVVVAPIRYGGGTRIKVLEALAYGKALVSTTFAAGGCGLEDGTHVRFADDAAAFADACVELLDGAAARAALGTAGRAFVAAHYDWAAIEASVPGIVAGALEAS
jgi:glycosyltransferase involved in cell wall biosynthesis